MYRAKWEQLSKEEQEKKILAWETEQQGGGGDGKPPTNRGGPANTDCEAMASWRAQCDEYWGPAIDM